MQSPTGAHSCPLLLIAAIAAGGVGMRFAASHRLNRPAAAWTGQPTIGQLNRWTDSSSLSGEIETRRGYDTHGECWQYCRAVILQ